MDMLPTETLGLIVEYVGVDCALHLTTPAMRAKVMVHVHKYEFRESGLIPLPSVKDLTIHDHFSPKFLEFYPSLVSLSLTVEYEFLCNWKLPSSLTKFSYNKRAEKPLLEALRGLRLIEWDLVVLDSELVHLVPEGRFARAKLGIRGADNVIPYGVTELISSLPLTQILSKIPKSVVTLHTAFFGQLWDQLPVNVKKLFGEAIFVRSDFDVERINRFEYVDYIDTYYELAVKLTVRAKSLYIRGIISYSEFLTLPDVEDLIFAPGNLDQPIISNSVHQALKSIAFVATPWNVTTWVPKSVTTISGIITEDYIKDLDIEFVRAAFRSGDNLLPSRSYSSGNLYINKSNVRGERLTNPKLLLEGAKMKELHIHFDGNLEHLVIPRGATVDSLFIDFAKGIKPKLSTFLPLIAVAKSVRIIVGNLIIDAKIPDNVDWVTINGLEMNKRNCTSREWKKFWTFVEQCHTPLV